MDVFTRVMYMHACTKDKKNLVDNWEAGHFKRVKREREMWALLLFADQRLAAHWETFQQSSRSSCRKIFCVEGAFLGCVRHVSGIVTPAARRLSTVGTRKAGPRSVSRTVVGGRPSYCCDTLAQVDCRWLPCPALLVSHFGDFHHTQTALLEN